MSVLATSTDTGIQLEVVAHHGHAGQYIGTVADDRCSLDRSGDFSLLNKPGLTGTENKFSIGNINLTTTESLILYQLAKNSGQVVSHNTLAEVVWGDYYPGAVDALRVYVRHLREKIEEDPAQPSIILTKTGVGYMMKPEG